MNGDAGGPYLKMALFCEKVLHEKDGVLSAIRIVDRIALTASGPDAPEEMPPIGINLTALLFFISGTAQGRHTLTVRPEGPSGLKLPAISLDVLFEGHERGPQVVLPMTLDARQEGIYWFDVSLDNQMITRMPLRVIYQRVSGGTLMKQ